jgi:hypothetical protein
MLATGLASWLAMLAAPALPADGASGLTGPLPGGCLPGERGYMQASLRGAVQAQLDWRGPALSCQGGVRADQQGIRLSLSGPLPASTRRLRIIIGLDVRPGRDAAAPTPANVTVIVEGENRIYATRGAGGCEVEALKQDALPAFGALPDAAPRARQFRVAARGFCIDPVPAMTAGATGEADRIYIDRFDFAALASFEPESIDAEKTAH